MSSDRRRFALRRDRPRKLPDERDWERSDVLDAEPSPRLPELVSDGAGLPFPPAALAPGAPPLYELEPAAAALLAHLRQLAQRGPRGSAPPTLAGWRTLARADGEALFGIGAPEQLVTVSMRLDPRRQSWSAVSASQGRPPRAVREGIRASAWRADPEQPAGPADTVLRVLVTEQTFAGGQLARGRILPPEVFLGDDELVMRIFVRPRPGYQAGSRNPETPVRVALPEPLGSRRLIDGAQLLR